jgi:dTDP-4-amino-4,6-dideoxygalactose transaminase
MTYLRTGREALLYASCNCKPREAAVILCPAYSCWSMIAPFEFSGWEVVYYRLNPDLTIDEEYLAKLLQTSRPDAILTMNFYGSASTIGAVAMAKLFNEKITVIEDFSHCTFCMDRIYNEQVDYYVTSIRKSIGVCDGALVLSKKPTNKHYIGLESSDFGNLRLVAQQSKGRYAFTKSLDQKDAFLAELRRGEEMIDQLDGIHPISAISMKMLETVNGEEIAFARRVNMKHLWGELQWQVRSVPRIEKSFLGAPFSLPILVENRDDVQRRLAKKGVYAPVLWPINQMARAVCENSAFVSDHMLSLPIDQRYDWDDMEDIAKIVLETVCGN